MPRPCSASCRPRSTATWPPRRPDPRKPTPMTASTSPQPTHASGPALARMPHELYIGGRWQPASGGQQIDVVDPSTETVIASVPDATPDDATAAVEAAAR